jgi:hypothetical protein
MGQGHHTPAHLQLPIAQLGCSPQDADALSLLQLAVAAGAGAAAGAALSAASSHS